MDEGHEPDKVGLASEPIKAGYSFEESSYGLSSALYFDKNLEKGLGSGVASSILYYGLNCDGGGLHLSASGAGKNVSKDENLDKMPSGDGVVDLYSARLSNSPEELFCDFEFSKKFPDMDYQFPQESHSWNSSLVSQSSGNSNKAVGASESSSQTFECQNNPPQRLITCELDGNYMPAFVWDMLVNDEMRANPSYSYDLQQCIGDTKNIASQVDTGKSYHCSNQAYFGIAPDQNHTRVLYDPSLQVAPVNKLAYTCDLQDFNEVSPMATSDTFNFSNEGYFGSCYDLNHLGAPCTSLSVQCGNAGLVDEFHKADDSSLLSILINKPAFSRDLQDSSEVSGVDTDGSYDHSDDKYFGAFNDKHLRASCSSLSMQYCDACLVDDDIEAEDPSLQAGLINLPVCSFDPQDIVEVKTIVSPLETSKSCHPGNLGYVTSIQLNCPGPLSTSFSEQRCDASPVDEVTEADHPTLQGVSVNKPADACDLLEISQVKTIASPMETKESYHGSNEGYVDDIGHDLNPHGVSFTSILTDFSDASFVDADKPSLQVFSVSKPVDWSDPHDIDEANNVASPVDTGESRHHTNEGYAATSDDLDPYPQGLSCNSVIVQGSDVSPMVEDTDTDDDDPTLQSLLIKRRARSKRTGPHPRQKRVQNLIQRCSDDSPAFKTRCLRKRKVEPTNSSKRKHVEAKSQNKHHRKRVKDGALVAHGAVSRRSSKQDLDSDEEYDPSQPYVGRGSDRRKNNKLWTLTEVIKLVDGISEFGVGKWTAIQRSLFESPPFRTSLDIRDKWRNLIRTSAFRLKHRRESETSSPKNGSMSLPKSLLAKICELDSVHPYRRSGVKRKETRSDDLLYSSSD